MFPLLQLKTTALDFGIPDISATRMLLLYALMLGVSMIPYALLYISLRRADHPASIAAKAPPATASPSIFGKLAARLHVHRHPELLHH